jgi:hypothetical protein
MTTETLTQPETKTMYRIYRFCETMLEWKGIAGYYAQSEALARYAQELEYDQHIKLTKETTQDLLIKGE